MTAGQVRVARRIEEIPQAPSVVTIGVFDGVHRGHAAIVGRAVSDARDQGLRSVAVTFDRHPMEVVRPGSQPKYLQTLDNKVTALLAEQVDLVYVIEFSYEFSQESAASFVDHTLCGPVQARKVVVGSNFRFGHGAQGDVAFLTEAGRGRSFETVAIDLLNVGDTAISSSEIRDQLGRGEVEWATRALGRPHALEGPVVRGAARGSSIGFPTANVEIDDRMQLPAEGVYAGHAVVLGGDGTINPAAISVGRNPTFGGTHVTVEAYLLDADLDLYGEHLAVSFEHRLRDQVAYASADELAAAIHRDVADTRRLLGV